MTQHTTNSIRNVVLASYAGAGKTSLAEALVYSAGVIPAMGSTLTGNTVGDFEPEEVHHHHSMSTALLHFDFKDTSFNILDAPGSLDFFADTKSTIHVADAAVLVIGASGLRSEVERIWDVIQEREIPSVIFVNELDKEHTNFESTLEEISKVLEIACIPIGLGPMRWPLAAENPNR
ncbi:MAG: GTP-binding protein [Nitrospinae bacterium]|nr:GTP-binding protein [Nitrospinota bacterium]